MSVVVLFFISWTPFHVQRLCYVYFKESYTWRTFNEYFFYFSGCLYFLSSTLNPVLYNLMSAKYRNAFQTTLCKQSTTSHEDTTVAPVVRAVASNGDHSKARTKTNTRQMSNTTFTSLRSANGGSFEVYEMSEYGRNKRLVRQGRVTSLDQENGNNGTTTTMSLLSTPNNRAVNTTSFDTLLEESNNAPLHQ